MAVEQERRVLMLWTAINELAPPDENPLRWAVGRTSMPFRTVDWARRIRNRVAHPDGNPINPRDVSRAGDILEDLLTRIGGTPPSAPAEDQAVDGSANGSGGGETRTEQPVRRPAIVVSQRKMPAATILLLIVGIGCTLSLYLALAGLPALVLSSIAMSKVYTDFADTQRLTRTGWRVFAIMLAVTAAGLALRWVTSRSLEL